MNQGAGEGRKIDASSLGGAKKGKTPSPTQTRKEKKTWINRENMQRYRGNTKSLLISGGAIAEKNYKILLGKGQGKDRESVTLQENDSGPKDEIGSVIYQLPRGRGLQGERGRF